LHACAASPVRKIFYLIDVGKWKKQNMKEASMEYKKSRKNAKRVISSAKEKKQKEYANDLNDSECHERRTWRNGTIRYQLRLRKDQQIASGWPK